jgi:hypothetical protein
MHRKIGYWKKKIWSFKKKWRVGILYTRMSCYASIPNFQIIGLERLKIRKAPHHYSLWNLGENEMWTGDEFLRPGLRCELVMSSWDLDWDVNWWWVLETWIEMWTGNEFVRLGLRCELVMSSWDLDWDVNCWWVSLSPITHLTKTFGTFGKCDTTFLPLESGA